MSAILSIHVLLMMVVMVCDDDVVGGDLLVAMLLTMKMTELSSESQAVIGTIDPHPYCTTGATALLSRRAGEGGSGDRHSIFSTSCTGMDHPPTM